MSCFLQIKIVPSLAISYLLMKMNIYVPIDQQEEMLLSLAISDLLTKMDIDVPIDQQHRHLCTNRSAARNVAFASN